MAKTNSFLSNIAFYPESFPHVAVITSLRRWTFYRFRQFVPKPSPPTLWARTPRPASIPKYRLLFNPLFPLTTMGIFPRKYRGWPR